MMNFICRFTLGVMLLLPIWGIAKDFKGAEYRTNSELLYGKFEARMQSAAGSGLLASLFTYHVTSNIPAEWNEIDVEILGRYTNQVQFNTISPGQVDHVYSEIVEYNPHESFHVYSFKWTPDYIAWSVDGYEVYRQTEPHVQQIVYAKQMMMNIWQPNYPTWVGSFDASILPVYAYYDWARYYNYTPGSNGNFTLLWEDNFDSYNQARWVKSHNHTWNGNNADLIRNNAVFQDGYLILCLTDDTNLGYSGAAIEDIDDVAPYPVWARAYTDKVIVAFSEEMEQASAEDIGNYNLPPQTITQARLLNDQKRVELTVPGIDNTLGYNLIMTGIRDQAVTPNTMTLGILLTEKPLEFPLNITVGTNTAAGEYLQDFTWNSSTNRGHTGGTTLLHAQSRQFDNTDDDAVYRSERRGITFYQANIENGVYRVTLMTAETQYTNPSSRVFNVYAEEQERISNLSIYGEAGNNQFHAVEKTIDNVVVNDGVLDLYFERVSGAPVLSGIRVEKMPTGLDDIGTIIPESFEWQVYPNPFNPSTTVSYKLDEATQVKLTLYNIRGQKVALLSNERKPAGAYQQRIQTPGLAAGLYLLQIELNNSLRDVKKLVYIK